MILTHHGSSVGSQQTRHTLQVKHMALSSPVEAGCGETGRVKASYKQTIRSILDNTTAGVKTQRYLLFLFRAADDSVTACTIAVGCWHDRKVERFGDTDV